MEQQIEVWQLVISVIVAVSTIGAMVIIGWINMRTNLVQLEQKYLQLDKEILEMKSRISNHDKIYLELTAQLPKMKEEIILNINDIKTDIAVIKTKM